MTGSGKNTVLKLSKGLGCAAASYHDTHIRNLRMRRIQADEFWSFVYGKDKNLTCSKLLLGFIQTERLPKAALDFLIINKRPA
jgi:hypothetical protein